MRKPIAVPVRKLSVYLFAILSHFILGVYAAAEHRKNQ